MFETVFALVTTVSNINTFCVKALQCDFGSIDCSYIRKGMRVCFPISCYSVITATAFQFLSDMQTYKLTPCVCSG